jgi:flagellar basal-body rod protein FlgB
MDPSNLGIFRMIDRRLAWADQRQKLLAQNVANSNTPGYLPRDLAPFEAWEKRPALAATAPLHLAGTGTAVGEANERPRSRTITGNGVAIEDQLLRVADTSNIQELSLNLHRRYAAMLRTAYGRNV